MHSPIAAFAAMADQFGLLVSTIAEMSGSLEPLDQKCASMSHLRLVWWIYFEEKCLKSVSIRLSH